MIIREIKESEVCFLQDMLYQAIFVEEGQPKLSKSITEAPSLSKYITDFGVNKYDICLVALENEKLIGAVWGRLFSEKNKGYGFLDSETPELSIAINKQCRGIGIGTKLIEGIIDVYQTLQVKSISLSVDKKNRAFALYKKLGFSIAAETNKSVVMRKKI